MLPNLFYIRFDESTKKTFHLEKQPFQEIL